MIPGQKFGKDSTMEWQNWMGERLGEVRKELIG